MNPKNIIYLLIAIMAIATVTAEASNAKATMPSQSYVGLWYDEYYPPNDLTILEIDENIIRFELGVYRIIGTAGTAYIENDKIVFDTDAYFSGTMQFNDNSIFLTVDKSDFDYIRVGTTYDFTVKAETSTSPFISEDETETAIFTDDLVSVSKASGNIKDKHHFYKDSKTKARVILRTIESVENFAYFEIKQTKDGEHMVGKMLFSLDDFTPEKPFVVSVEIGEGIPTRGIRFSSKNNVHYFYLTESGIDGSLNLVEFTPKNSP